MAVEKLSCEVTAFLYCYGRCLGDIAVTVGARRVVKFYSEIRGDVVCFETFEYSVARQLFDVLREMSQLYIW